MTNAQLIDHYVDFLDNVRNLTYTTTAHCRRVCRNFAALLLSRGNDQIARAQPDDVLAWVDKRLAEGVAHRTISRELCILRTFYQHLLSFHATTDPTACLPEFICRPYTEQPWLTVEEVFSMLEKLDTADPFHRRNYLIIALLWSTGLRSSELCALRWCDLDLENATLLVRKGKGNRQRQIYLNDRILEDLRNYRRSILAGDQTPVFCRYPIKQRSAGSGLTLRYLSQIIRQAATNAGIQWEVSPMTLRHTFATHMYQVGIPLRDIKEMMGHQKDTETTVYIHVTVEAVKYLLSNHVTHTLRFKEDRP